MAAKLFGLFLPSLWIKQILHIMFFFFFMEQTAAGSCRVKVWARHSFISVSPVKKSFIRTLNPCCKLLWIWTWEKRFRCKKAQTKRLQYFSLQQICILIKKKNVLVCGRHWQTSCFMNCLSAACEATHTEGRGEKEGRHSNVALRTEREKQRRENRLCI